MKIQSALMLAMAGSAMASAPFMAHDSEIAADSRLGGKLLSKARRLNNNNDQGDVTWIANFSLKFKGCHSMKMFGVEGARENEGGMGMMNLVKFQLCPSGSCVTCFGGAEYIVEMREFIETYMEAKKEADNNENYYGKNNNDMKYNECREAGFGDNNNNYYNDNNNGYFIGPYCSNGGRAIHLGLFKDEGCLTKVSASKYKDYYGTPLPYTSESMVSRRCISCLAGQDNDGNNNGDYNYYKDPSETCANLHERAGKCEKRIKGIDEFPYYTPNTDACTWIHALPAIAKTVNSNGAAVRVPVALAWIFGTITLGFGTYCCYMYKKIKKMNINIVDDDEKPTVSRGIFLFKTQRKDNEKDTKDFKREPFYVDYLGEDNQPPRKTGFKAKFQSALQRFKRSASCHASEEVQITNDNHTDKQLC